jgi:Polysaccharide lyase
MSLTDLNRERRGRGRVGRILPVAGVLLAASLVMALLMNAQISPRIAPSNPPPPGGPVVWAADTETGDVSQWTKGQFDEAVFNTGTGSVEASTDVARSGSYSLKMSIEGASGETQAARILRWHDTPEAGYYSVWFDFPRIYHPAAWWNVLQFKSQSETDNVPTWVLNVGNRPDGSMYFYLWDGLTNTSYSPLHRVDLPVDSWFQVKVFFRRAIDKTGRITVWQGSVLLFDVDQVQTAIADNTHFGIGNYTDDITPPNPVIYADDAVIRTVLNPSSSLDQSGNPQP